MKVTAITTRLHERYLPLSGWDQVRQALRMFADDRASVNGRTAEDLTLREIGGSAPEARVQLEGVSDAAAQQDIRRGKSSVVQEILEEAYPRVLRNGSFFKECEYRHQGTPFFRTDIEISLLDPLRQTFALGLQVGGLGDAPEASLAAALGISRGVTGATVAVASEPLPGHRFHFDFEKIIRPLDPVLGTEAVRGESVVRSQIREHYDFKLYRKRNVSVSIRTGNVDRTMETRDGKTLDTWTGDGPLLCGGLLILGDGTIVPPTVEIHIRSRIVRDMEAVALFEKKDKVRITGLTDRIAAALSPLATQGT